MRYTIVSFIYWPIWLGFRAEGFSYLGMLLGAIAITAMWFVMWRIQFGTWKLGY